MEHDKPDSPKLQKLRAQRETLEHQIRQEQARITQRQRKADTRRKILAGAAVLDEAELKPEFRKGLYELLGRFLTRSDDRKLFGLPPVPEPAEKTKLSIPTKPQ